MLHVAYFFSTSALALTIIRPSSSRSWLFNGKKAGFKSAARFRSSSDPELTASGTGRTMGFSSTVIGGGGGGGGGRGFSTRAVSTAAVVGAGAGVVLTFGCRGLQAAAL